MHANHPDSHRSVRGPLIPKLRLLAERCVREDCHISTGSVGLEGVLATLNPDTEGILRTERGGSFI